MKLVFPVIALSLIINSTALAVISEGEYAPDFTARATTSSEQAPLSLSSLLAHGPVVLYFLSSSNPPECRNELRTLADSTQEFDEFHTSVVGILNAPDETIEINALTGCGSELLVIADPEQSIAKAYEVAAQPGNSNPGVSVLISPQGEVIHVHTSADVYDLVDHSLDAVQDWSQLVDQEY